MTRRQFNIAVVGLGFAPALRSQVPRPSALDWLQLVMDRGHRQYFVYNDADSAYNHFPARALLWGGPGASTGPDLDAAPPMDEQFSDPGADGLTCIRAGFNSRSTDHWAGWLMMNGTLSGSDSAPQLNFGDVPHAGIDLRGASSLSFRARGIQGGEVIQFFAFGVGWDNWFAHSFPDSANKQRKTVTLTDQWQTYTMDISDIDLRYCLGAFGWVADAKDNKYQSISFLIDSVWCDLPRLSEPRFLVSYETEYPNNSDPLIGGFDRVQVNTAYTYDNAVALLAYVATGQRAHAQLLADALVYALNNDRYWTDGRMRNAYMGGDLTLPPGWLARGKSNTVRMPGWYDVGKAQWYEDAYNVSCNSGVMAWVCLSLLAFFESYGGESYLAAVKRIAGWIIGNCEQNSKNNAFTAGQEGWEPDAAGKPSAGFRIRTYEATEHSIDLFAVFSRLYRITGDSVYRDAAQRALNFVTHLAWNSSGNEFYTGTDDNGVLQNFPTSIIPLDIQVWSLMSLRGQNTPYLGTLDTIERLHAVSGGYGFCQTSAVRGTATLADGTKDTLASGVWYEGTAHVATAHRLFGSQAKYEELKAFLDSVRYISGAMPAASVDKLDTGFNLNDGDPWVYFHRPHVGATGWFVLATTPEPVNPFWLGSE